MDWTGQRVLVTGATGFIGTHLTRRLAAEGAEVWAGLYPAEASQREASLPSGVRQVSLDVVDAESVQRAVVRADPRVVIHLAAVGVSDREIDPSLALAVNAGGAVNLLEAVMHCDVSRVILLGTCYEYGALEAHGGLDPSSAYAASKLAAWAFGRAFWWAHGLPVVAVRPFQVYGPGQPRHALVPSAIEAAITGLDFPMTAGEQERDFIYVDDVVDGIVAVASAGAVDGESIDLGTGVTWPVRAVVERIWTLAHARGEIRTGALPYRPGEARRLVADADRATALTGWRAATSLEQGLRQTINDFAGRSAH